MLTANVLRDLIYLFSSICTHTISLRGVEGIADILQKRKRQMRAGRGSDLLIGASALTFAHSRSLVLREPQKN